MLRGGGVGKRPSASEHCRRGVYLTDGTRLFRVVGEVTGKSNHVWLEDCYTEIAEIARDKTCEAMEVVEPSEDDV